MPPKKTMKAMKVTEAPKAIKTTSKAPKSMKIMKAATAKGKSKKAEDKSLNTNVLEPSCEGSFSCYGAEKIKLFYEGKPFTKTADDLKMMIAATLLEPAASNARRVGAHRYKV